MPLLLAIEPDKSQASWIAEQARGPLNAELIVTESVDGAIEVLRARIPDLILTSTLLSPRDESRLQTNLRLLDSTGYRVQTLVIPMLAEPSSEPAPSAASGMLSRLVGRRPIAANANGCDPAVFGTQIAEYLTNAKKQRSAKEAGPASAPALDPVAAARHAAFLAVPYESPAPPPVAEPAPSLDLPMREDASAARDRSEVEGFLFNLGVLNKDMPTPLLVDPDPIAPPPAAFEPEPFAVVAETFEVRVEPEPIEIVQASPPVPPMLPVEPLELFRADDKMWRPRYPIGLVAGDEFDADAVIGLLDPERPARASDPDASAMLAALRVEIDQLKTAPGSLASTL